MTSPVEACEVLTERCAVMETVCGSWAEGSFTALITVMEGCALFASPSSNQVTSKVMGWPMSASGTVSGELVKE